MKLVIRCVRNRCRRASILNCGCHGDRTLETPMCMLYTKGGSVPYLSKDMIEKITTVPKLASVSLSDWAEHSDALSEFQKGVAKFSSLQSCLVYSCIHDEATEVPRGYNEKTGVAVWSKGGKIKLDVPEFMKIQEALCPDWYQALSDGDTDNSSSLKRVKKAVDRTLSFLDDILDTHHTSQRLQCSEVFGVVEGGYNIDERSRSAQETAYRNVSGFVIDGFQNIDQTTNSSSFEEILEILKTTVSFLPEDLPRLMTGVWKPDAVLDGIQQGLDIFGSSYPYSMTEKGQALVFKFDKRSEQETSVGFEIDLNHKRFCEDFAAILPGCTCYSCRKFSRAYVHHLLNTSELLGGVLLMIHNLHHYFQFFECVRQSLTEDTFEDLKTLINKQKLDIIQM